MNPKIVAALYKKEILDIIRDKKTLLVMILLPLLLYPLLMIGGMALATTVLSSQEERTYQAAFDGFPEALRQDLTDWITSDQDELDYHFAFSDWNPSASAAASDTAEGTQEAPAQTASGTAESTQEAPAQTASGTDNDAAPSASLDTLLADSGTDLLLRYAKDGAQQQITIHYLSANTNSDTAAGMMREEIESYAKHIAEENAEAQGLDIKSILYPVTASLQNESGERDIMGMMLGMILPFLLVASISMAAIYPSIDITAGEKERGTLETLLTLPVRGTELITAKFLAVSTMAVAAVFLNLISMGFVAAYIYQSMRLTGAADTTALHLSSFIPALLLTILCVIAFALFVSAICMCVCAFASSFKEANNYITPLTLVFVMCGYVSLIPNIELTRTTALIPGVNLCLLIKELLTFRTNVGLIPAVLLINILCAFLSVLFLGKIYNSEAILFGGQKTQLQIFERRKNLQKGTVPTIAESLLMMIVTLLLMIYAGGLISLKNVTAGVVSQQLFIMIIPLLTAFYIKTDFRRTFSLRLPSLTHLAGGFLLWLGTYPFALGLSQLLIRILPESSTNLNSQFYTILADIPFPVALIMIALMPALGEELFFRGYMFTAFRARCKPLTALLWTSFLFGVMHMSLVRLVPTALLGAALAFAVLRSGSLLVSSLMHFLNNSVALVLLYFVQEGGISSLNNILTEDSTVPVWQALLLLCIGIPFIFAGILLLGGWKKRKS